VQSTSRRAPRSTLCPYTTLFRSRFRASDQLTIDAGLRYDRQTLTDSTKDFAPRLGFAWHPGNDSRLVVRGGYAMYYPQLRTNWRSEEHTPELQSRETLACRRRLE